jgi:putative Mn2+ efflux pump MntP
MDTLAAIAFPLVAIALASFVLALGGCFIGSLIGNKLKFPVEPLGGVVLIILGIKILCEHLM